MPHQLVVVGETYTVPVPCHSFHCLGSFSDLEQDGEVVLQLD